MAFAYRTDVRRNGYVVDSKRIVAIKSRAAQLGDEWRSTIYLDSGQELRSLEMAEALLERLERLNAETNK